MATDAKKITIGATTEILCFTLQPKSYDKVTIRCLSTVTGSLKTLYRFGDGDTYADDTATTVTASGSSAARSMIDSDGNSASLATAYASNLMTQVFDYRLGEVLVTFTPGASTAGTLWIEAITIRSGEK